VSKAEHDDDEDSAFEDDIGDAMVDDNDDDDDNANDLFMQAQRTKTGMAAKRSNDRYEDEMSEYSEEE
jgi:hypothetical protein